MITDYSKPSADIALEANFLQTADHKILQCQRELSAMLASAPDRTSCLLCGQDINSGRAYRHRQVEYLFCSGCGHLQTKAQLPSGYPLAFSGQGFDVIYPRLDEDAYRSRRDRIYLPKLEWAFSRLSQHAGGLEKVSGASWLEIGCGAGYFLNALRERGVEALRGLDADERLVAVTNQYCGDGVACSTVDLFGDVANAEADIYVAFFVLEHLEEVRRFWQIMGQKPAGTVFLFSVPTFGFAAAMEGAMHDYAARSLDSVLHTQLYTDQSIDYALAEAGYEKTAEWLFGQDAQDLCRIIAGTLQSVMDAQLAETHVQKLSVLIDPLQKVLDQARYCDARHIIAIKR